MNRNDGEKLHASVLVAPAKERRRYRKQRRQAANQLHHEQTAAEERRGESSRRRRESRARRTSVSARRRRTRPVDAAHTGPLPPAPASRHLRHPVGAYPFVAEGGLGSSGVFVGQDLYSGGSFVYDPWVLYANGVITAPNVVLAGIVGSGKS